MFRDPTGLYLDYGDYVETENSDGTKSSQSDYVQEFNQTPIGKSIIYSEFATISFLGGALLGGISKILGFGLQNGLTNAFAGMAVRSAEEKDYFASNTFIDFGIGLLVGTYINAFNNFFLEGVTDKLVCVIGKINSSGSAYLLGTGVPNSIINQENRTKMSTPTLISSIIGFLGSFF
jgi:hypothetical protein